MSIEILLGFHLGLRLPGHHIWVEVVQYGVSIHMRPFGNTLTFTERGPKTLMTMAGAGPCHVWAHSRVHSKEILPGMNMSAC